MEEIDDLVKLFERPARLSGVTGLPVTVSLTADASQAVASLLKLFGGRSPDLTRDQIERILKLMFENTGLFTVIKLWLLHRIRRWAASR